ncbi:putative entry exclusion protein TrbK-alt [Consotaella salsifontis]|uniref:Conjugative transfer region protein TrbK n=1 Tax=Consotaella salsifontis TaxID=1365950 RepID=A0A1T4TF58_9HYPH|nr:putative entry exclusion protein TrbK-alt [Consotaella salsifontis]SKA16237.1 conjugative transfer region protein TrbK [Consotaella salsifontis]SKA37274.1 conjugative transfer region protein TrbK [Consotaella salsifontis]SKA38951.1 conjugative transfer region protein TrbK [Consotaella salsifontis]
MQAEHFARLAAGVFVAVALAVAVLGGAGREEEPASEASVPSSAIPANPLRAEMIRCARIGEAAIHDAACLETWAENRRRFLSANDDWIRDRLPVPPRIKPEAR